MSYALMLVQDFQQAKSLARIADGLLQVGKSWADKLLSDDEYQMLSAFLHLKQKSLRDVDTVAVRMPQLVQASMVRGFTSYFPAKKKRATSPDRERSQERRKMLASLGGLPSDIARRFTVGQQAVLKILADEVKRKGCCMLYLGEIAARAGVCLTTARDTIREAAYQGLVTIQERKQKCRPNLSNIVRIINHDWREWISSRRFFATDFFGWTAKAAKDRGGASKEVGATDKDFTNPTGKAASQPHSVPLQPSG